MKSLVGISKLFIITVLGLLLQKIRAYDWLIQYSYIGNSCSPQSVDQAILFLQNKCFQTEVLSNGATTNPIWKKYTCNNQTTGQITISTTTYVSADVCSTGSSGANSGSISTKSEIASDKCSNTVKESCVSNPDVENWPGYGIWENPNPSLPDTLGVGSCSEATGPDNIRAFPNTCQTDGQTSWIYKCDVGSSAYIEKNMYKGTTCSGTPFSTTYLGGDLYSGGSAPIGKCLPVSDKASSAYRAFYSCSIKSIPGVTNPPRGPNCWAKGEGPQNAGCGSYTAGHFGSQSSWMVGGLASLLLGIFFVVGACGGGVWYYFHTIEAQRKADAFQQQSESAKV